MSAPIIITVPKYLKMEDGDSQMVMLDVAPSTPSRKRRLDHLTWEEKMQRKKLKNRVAAQTSRDRKKAKMDEMESKIDHFMAINERLVKEVEDLKAMNERLLSENASLRSEAAARTVAEAPRPAASPQQKEGPPSAIRAARLLLTMCLLSQTSSLTSSQTNTLTHCTNLQTPSSRKLMQVLQERLKMENRKCSEGPQVVGTAAKQLESSKNGILDAEINMKHDVDRIMEHSYAHPYPGTEAPEVKEDGDKGDIFYASYEANDCVTVEVPCDEIVEETSTDMDFNTLTQNCSDITLECDLKLLSPMTLSPQSIEENLGLSPSHTNLSSDLGYESLASPFSEPDLDLSDFWCESFSELFPALA